ncbi:MULTISPECIES: DNA mismatch repair protein MutS [unclassified Chelatococcus]|uniref:DNA mismatch repair protein MutS n=1 Tax=unclassified Chelatococcus TaxID=2638111 RepID=UPI001BD106D3|nr:MULTISPECIES: DNA mismatch repair protein MutS [unclassified Chelatococcus]CAH1661593.1 DNA mismatch repair protein MutS [Hyphomicrobiales bacterium]MBS7741280.1 DNA mismatch repair protein MutS [Chelatococcus sp. HY11]MBX3546238.1 DNA mismatch repair protein MutS [Chelatococcus sp.]MCO5078103.1 DNA mismatch repair protein MutS [Chelatococcus sp.]CAH1683048.1 DNA mismatch repair protein MutS [Hyphomicrobiales bacterium]
MNGPFEHQAKPSDTTKPGPAPADGRVTPMMAQYTEIKLAHPNCLLFYRMGDFYELFFEDAEIASRTLGIVLTKRGKHLGEDIPMCGVPVEKAEDYLQRLIAAGHRVAVCEQTEDPAEAKKRGGKSVVARGVVRLVTPGTITEDSLLDPARANLLVAVTRRRAGDQAYLYGLAAIDISTGRFTVAEVEAGQLAADLARLDPRELLVPDTLIDDPDLATLWREIRTSITPMARDGLDAASADRRLKDYFGVASLDAFGVFTRTEVAAAALVLGYVDRTQLGSRPPLSPPAREAAGGTLLIDAATRANLELSRTLSGERGGSLLAAVDRTLTSAGGRLLAERLAGPSTDLAVIRARHDAVAYLVDRAFLREGLRARLRAAPDMARALSRLALGRGGPRDLAALRDGLGVAGVVAGLLTERDGEEAGDLPKKADLPNTADRPAELSGAAAALSDLAPELAGQLQAALADELPLLKRDGGFVRPGHLPALDEARLLQADSRRFIAALQARYVGETGCRTLKVKHNNVLGYFVEVPQAAGEDFLKPPLNELFVHRQTMAGTMRFSTVELGELEAKIASASDRAVRLELAVFDELVGMIAASAEPIKRAADALGLIDVTASLADLAADLGWSRPEIEDSLAFRIEGGRHPVVEAALKASGGTFVANDCDLTAPGGKSGAVTLITGPNMAGKSTYLRQNALIVVLAQMGAFVPARAARIGIVDRLFSRVGAADDLARGRSTFMVEMIETAAILNQAGPRALVILDEIGRGTATFDGLSIAWAAVEHLEAVNRSRALFATHYHELTALADRLDNVSNATMRVTDWHGDVVFLHEVVPGAADRSYGIQVAKLAGLPAPVIARAREVLDQLEKTEREKPVSALIDDLPLFAATLKPVTPPPAVAAAGPDLLREALGGIDPDDMTPREALEALYRLKRLSASA